jgi:hypothetical protein
MHVDTDSCTLITPHAHFSARRVHCAAHKSLMGTHYIQIASFPSALQYLCVRVTYFVLTAQSRLRKVHHMASRGPASCGALSSAIFVPVIVPSPTRARCLRCQCVNEADNDRTWQDVHMPTLRSRMKEVKRHSSDSGAGDCLGGATGSRARCATRACHC